MIQVVKHVRQVLLYIITNVQRLYQTAVFMTKWGTASNVQKCLFFLKISVKQRQHFKTVSN